MGIATAVLSFSSPPPSPSFLGDMRVEAISFTLTLAPRPSPACVSVVSDSSAARVRVLRRIPHHRMPLRSAGVLGEGRRERSKNAQGWPVVRRCLGGSRQGSMHSI